MYYILINLKLLIDASLWLILILGQMNLNMSELEQAQEMSGTEEYLRNIWKTLNVGLNGYITSQELGQVCDHIGMEMNKTVSNWLLAPSQRDTILEKTTCIKINQ